MTTLSVRDEQWLYEVDERFFLPPVSQSLSLVYFQHLLLPCCSDWELVRSRGVIVSQLEGIDILSRAEEVLGLFLGHVQDGYSQGEASCLANVFGGQYLKSISEYPPEVGWMVGFHHRGDKWWS